MSEVARFFLLLSEALVLHFIVFVVHGMRDRFTFGPFYGLLGLITASMWWVSTAGASVEMFGITFIVGGVVFYNSLLIAVFIIYLFDGPAAARIAILTIVAFSLLTPGIIWVLNHQLADVAAKMSGLVPVFGFRQVVSSAFSSSPEFFPFIACLTITHICYTLEYNCFALCCKGGAAYADESV